MSIELSFDIGVLNPWGGCLGQSPKETKLLTPSLNDYSKLLQPVYDTLKLFNQHSSEMLNINRQFLEICMKHGISRLCYIDSLLSIISLLFKESHVFSL